jgi:hypothetical protein
MARRSLVVVLFVAFATVFGAALAYRSLSVSAPSVPATVPAPTAPVTAPATASAREVVQLTVYFPSRRYVESGDESLPRVVAERHQLEVADGSAGVDTLASAAMAALQAGPKSAAATLAIPERLVIRQVQVRDGVAYVDFSRAGLSGGSLEETLLVKSIVLTLTSVPQVRAVQFLVEGKAPETLMGHVTTTKPISVVE